MIDLHCHLLPAIDDGPPALGEALRLAQAQVRAEVAVVAATPHVNDRYPTEGWRIARGIDELRAALRAAEIPLEVVPGAELDPVAAIERSDDELRALALGGSATLLLEAPLGRPAPLEEIVQRLHHRGFSVLLAHPERSPQLHRDPAMLRRLVRAGVRTQITAAAFGGAFGRTVRLFAEQLAAEGLVHLVASDAHDATGRPPGLREPLEHVGLGRFTELLCREHPAAVLAGEPLPARVLLRRDRPLLRRLGMVRR